MLSLPMIAPRPDSTLWPSLHAHHTTYDPETHTPNQTSHTNRRPSSRHSARTQTSHLLTALATDENTIEQRKTNVRRFGAGWLRPPGVAKTLQAMKDEELEREEQEAMQRREQVMLDLAAAQQDAANEEARQTAEAQAEGGRMEGVDGEEEERDLDDEVPEASASESASDSDDSDSDAEASSDAEQEQELTVPFNEDSFIEGSGMEAEVSHMLDMQEAEMAGVLQDERDLDDDVPEAGSYEHTDSELEDDSSEVDNSQLTMPRMASVRSRRSTRSTRRWSGRSEFRRSEVSMMGVASPVVQTGGASRSGSGSGVGSGRLNLTADIGHGRSSFGMEGSSSILEGSSFLRSSPAGAAAVNRGSLRDRFLGVARGGRRA